MRVERIADRGHLLTFDDEISLYLISGASLDLLCDTHLGPVSMEEIFETLKYKPENHRLLIFNSHSDWDHIWGNCVFSENIIIGHELCRQRLKERGAFDLMQNVAQKRGDVQLIPPNLTFTDQLTLEDEGIRFDYAPGHTVDSSVCYDMADEVLYLGDLVEDPIPYLDAYDLDQYITTLTSLLDHPARILISAHSGLVTRDLIKANIAYIQAIRDEVFIDPAHLGSYGQVHRWNLNMRFVHQVARQEKSGGNTELVKILIHAGDLHYQDPVDLKSRLMGFASILP
ncbi:MAG TPA: MBL fold metallo-hydrolase [Methanospirillum sp.]|uniref:MBL fold metallo-hydrolase n=1 Tax=Methanospirillum sp. TaxID=45200 RepID=UPI002C6A4BC7|nr:MBL fold metallo-hydrolase [Methanospirillum sp.]HWQ64875.1 MBL fold metallo-hydrolase [Methanospirillum sp.]